MTTQCSKCESEFNILTHCDSCGLARHRFYHLDDYTIAFRCSICGRLAEFHRSRSIVTGKRREKSH